MGERKDTQQRSSSVYTAADFYQLRSSVLPAHIFTQIAATSTVVWGTEETDEELAAVRQRCYDLLQSLAAQSKVEQALAVASFSMLKGVAHIRQDKISRRTERSYSRLLRYLIRMSTRPTPFGLFAGVAVGTFALDTTARLYAPPVKKIRTRPDMSWLLSVIRNVEQEQEIAQLHVAVNHTAYLAGGRAILPYADVYGQHDQRSISLRATSVVRYILERARQPTPYRDLHGSIQEKFPQASTEQVDRLLQQLWENHFLTSDLRPPLTSADPANYVLERLVSLPSAEVVSKQLKAVLQKVTEIDGQGVGGSIRLIHDLKQLQEQLVPESESVPFQIDTALNLESCQLTRTIGEAAAQAGETLLRLSRGAKGMRHLEEYRMAFIERYGLEAEVPLLDLLSPEIGLDAPSTYGQPPRTYPLSNPLFPPDTHRRDTVLCGLVHQALNEHLLEVELTDATLQQLEEWSPLSDTLPPPSLEIYLQLHAASRKALDQGGWRVVVSPNCGSQAGGRTFCRFFDIQGMDTLEKLQHFIRQEESLTPGVIFAELSYLPTNARAANVAIRPELRGYEITINTTPSVPPDRVIHLHDLVVGIRDQRFYVRSLSLSKEVVVCQSHMLNPALAPNMCRFLLEVAQDRYPSLSPFDWGANRDAPYLPRLVQGRVVLCPAQWNVKAAMIEPTRSGSEESRWFRSLQQWRAQWRVPRYVYLVEADNRLLLDLEHPLMAAELRGELEKVGDADFVRIQEMLPDFEHLWLQDSNNASYVAEIVVPLIRTAAQKTPAPGTTEIQHTYPPHIVTKEERSILPGSDWIYLKLYAAFKQHEGFIAGPLREIAQALQERGMIDRWFFIRYADPEPHLRVRFHAASAQVNEPVLLTVLTWGRQQVEAGMASRICLDTYDREVERYGGPQALDIMEQIFAIDSTLIAHIIATQNTGHITVDPLAVAVWSLDQLFDAWGLDLAARLLRLEKRTEKYQASKEFREQRRLFCELLSPWDQTYDSVVTAQRETLEALFSAQRASLRRLAAQISQLAAQGELWLAEERILDSLAHMHVNRLLGIDREQENKVYAFWRHTLESIRRRPPTGKER